MRFLICVLLVALIACTGLITYSPPSEPDYSVAACGVFGGNGILGIRGRIRDRRAAGEGLGQGRYRRAGLRGC